MASRLAMFALLLVFAVWGAWPNYVATARVEGTCGQNSRRITFLTPVGGFYLEGHVFSNHSVELNLDCQDQCALARECVSYNIGPKINNKMACELSNSDHFQHPEDLKPRKDWIYRGTKNPCASQPCLNNGTCYMGYTEKNYVCACTAGFKGENCEQVYSNCAELYKAGLRTSGVYTIDPDNTGAFDVYCDQTTAGGGWTVFQKRLDGSVDFYRGWDDYKRGFGNLNGEFWLGLEKIHRLTKEQRRLRVDLEDFGNQTAYAEYDSFGVGDEQSKYKLGRLGQYAGTAGDSLTTKHHNMPFSTKDQDNDQDPGKSCAISYKGAWWYNKCHESNLNGRYLNGKHSSTANGVNWLHWKGHYYSAKRAEMKIKPVEA
ncbi:microfibril-associated glycoprotein 4-like [Porites lutea]|uniref:microfibril-associated glycoprotein 4-like n=1 Tax=Porites lutea TaxID=51062 RepID=UPI003CC5D90D